MTITIPGLAGAVLLVAATVGLVIGLLRKRNSAEQHATLVAAALVAGLALVAHNAWVYSVAVFLVAAPIAGPAFAENIAALAWDRKWWRVADKGEPLPDESPEPETPVRGEPEAAPALKPEHLPSHVAYETLALNALRHKMPEFQDWRREVVLANGTGRSVRIDAMAHDADGNPVLFEFKRAGNPGSLRKAENQLSSYIDRYAEASGASNVSATLVIPAGDYTYHPSDPRVQVLRYKPDSGEFESE